MMSSEILWALVLTLGVGVGGILISMSGPRIQTFFEKFVRPEKRNILLIWGAGKAGRLALAEVNMCRQGEAKVVGYIDQDTSKKGRTIEGLRVMGSLDDVSRIVAEKGIDEIVIAFNQCSVNHKAQIREKLANNNQKVTISFFPSSKWEYRTPSGKAVRVEPPSEGNGT